jgi:hypothetical protein
MRLSIKLNKYIRAAAKPMMGLFDCGFSITQKKEF